MEQRKKSIAKISVPEWELEENSSWDDELGKRYTKYYNDRAISHISVTPARYGKKTMVTTSGGLFGIRDKDFSTDIKANAYARMAMLHINKTVKNFGY